MCSMCEGRGDSTSSIIVEKKKNHAYIAIEATTATSLTNSSG